MVVGEAGGVVGRFCDRAMQKSYRLMQCQNHPNFHLMVTMFPSLFHRRAQTTWIFVGIIFAIKYTREITNSLLPAMKCTARCLNNYSIQIDVPLRGTCLSSYQNSHPLTYHQYHYHPPSSAKLSGQYNSLLTTASELFLNRRRL